MKPLSNKIVEDQSQLQQQVRQWQEDGLKVVFTNGCFDLIHLGHIQYLREAKALGDKLVVALNTDASVSRLKGSHRPVNDEASRLEVMAAFEFTDAVTTFGEETPYEIIQLLRPDVLVKGGDWAVEKIIGSDIVLSAGGKVISLSFAPGYSTTNLEQKIISAHNAKS
ncbi:MAG: D-glycero-beta-D-manno-heptose 1-phosphate adenylyltransferase [Saprospiraceae bacterium]|nr:D-glycero-beta-D-manno-heptose 1-phosphate adenylyltransferase [Saprospiraceae bacterium]